MKTGITTGACAALAAKAAALLLAKGKRSTHAEIPLPDGSRLQWPLSDLRLTAQGAEASVVKDAGDDPDVTHGATISACVRWNNAGEVRFFAGEGVGTVTRPGLAVPAGEPAINPGPRRMIEEAIAEVTDRGVDVTVAVAGGEQLAGKTFNPRLGIEGGISILGSTGRVRPYSVQSLRASLLCSFSVAAAAGVKHPVLVPGNMGNRAARRHLAIAEDQVVEVSNEWGFMLDASKSYPFEALLALGHPGKLAKLAAGEWQTHSGQSASAVPYVSAVACSVLERTMPEANTVEALLMTLPDKERGRVGNELAVRIQKAISKRLGQNRPVAVTLINLRGDMLGTAGDLQLWQ